MKPMHASCWSSTPRRGFVLSFTLVTFVAVVAIGGCGSTRVYEVKSPDSPEHYDAVELTALLPETNAPTFNSFAKEFDQALRRYLFEEGGLREGPGLGVEYEILSIDSGDRTLRFLVGLGAGKGQIKLNVKYFDAVGEEIAVIVVKSEVTDGMTGGSFTGRVEKAARVVADYTFHTVLGRARTTAR